MPPTPLRARLLTMAALLGTGACAAVLGLDDYPGASVAAVGDAGCASCSPFGRCVDAPTGARCECDESHAGPTCDACGPGFESDAGQCLAVCGGVTCPLHARCDGATFCRCVTGYQLESGSCAWRGGPRDPGFTGDPAAWSTPDGAVFDASFDGALFSPGLLRAPMGSVEQTFDMPSFAESEPFALDLAFQTVCPNCAYAPVAEVGTGSAFTSAPAGPGPRQASKGIWRAHLCLGDAAYGAQSSLLLGGTLDPNGFYFDDLRYTPDPTCPRPGEVVNGDFELRGGWIPTSQAGIVAGIGSQASRAAQLGAPSGADCGERKMTGRFSVPAAMSRPAVELALLAPIGMTVDLLVEDRPVATLAGAGTENVETICMKPWMRGLSTTLGLQSSCTPGVAVIDDVRVVDRASCPLGAALTDGDFENAGRITVWSSYRDNNGGRGSVLHDGFDAHAGTGYLKLVGDGLCIASVTQDIQVPLPVGAAGPAVKLWAKGSTTGRLEVASIPVNVTSTYASYTFCLPPERAGRRFDLHVGMRSQESTFGCTGSAFVDDVQATTDPSCPAR